MKIILLSFFSVFILGLLIIYSGGFGSTLADFFHPKVSIPAPAATSTPEVTTPYRSPYAPVYPARPSNPMPTPANFRGPTASGTPYVHGPSGPPPNY